MLCRSQGFAGPSACVLERGHEGPHKYGEIEKAEAEQIRKDAARYQWLRKNRDVLLLTGFFGNGCINRTIGEVDAAIDRAMLVTANAKVRGPEAALSPETPSRLTGSASFDTKRGNVKWIPRRKL